jgi:hypothetical protein
MTSSPNVKGISSGQFAKKRKAALCIARAAFFFRCCFYKAHLGYYLGDIWHHVPE